MIMSMSACTFLVSDNIISNNIHTCLNNRNFRTITLKNNISNVIKYMIQIKCEKENFKKLESWLFSIELDSLPEYQEIEVEVIDDKTYKYKIEKTFEKYYIVTSF